jgi:D-sedoheptulose 7-phosphate isomerase
LANDFGYDMVFEKQVEGLIQAGDILIGISTSGKSKIIAKAIETAKKAGAKTLALTGGGGGTLDQVADFSVSIPSKNTPRIQEAHITIIHIICELVEEALFSA